MTNPEKPENESLIGLEITNGKKTIKTKHKDGTEEVNPFETSEINSETRPQTWNIRKISPLSRKFIHGLSHDGHINRSLRIESIILDAFGPKIAELTDYIKCISVLKSIIKEYGISVYTHAHKYSLSNDKLGLKAYFKTASDTESYYHIHQDEMNDEELHLYHQLKNDANNTSFVLEISKHWKLHDDRIK